MLNKRGQVTLFVIIAVVIVAVVVLFLVIRGQRGQDEGPGEVFEPKSYIQEYINIALESLVETIAIQGGYLEPPESTVFWKDTYIALLCTTTKSGESCVNQKPLLKLFIEEQLENNLTEIAKDAVSTFKNEAENLGYDVTTCSEDEIELNVSLIGKKVNVILTCPITLTKTETLTFKKFETSLIWPLYDFVMLTGEIINEEIKTCEFDSDTYMNYNKWVKIIRDPVPNNADEVYILTEIATDKTFMFAIRNCVP